jgi:hypothetical protein
MELIDNIPGDLSFDKSENLLVRKNDKDYLHTIPNTNAKYALNLVELGTPEALQRAEKVIEAVLKCQELDEKNKHFGNFFWEKEDGFVEDLNAVEFVMISFIPMIMRYGDRLSENLKKKILISIKLALHEIKKINVNLIYTNIVAKDIVNSILGGQLLGDSSFKNRGKEKLKKWHAHIDKSGIPTEYNSPGYSSITINTLSNLIELSDDEESIMIAKLILLRIGISYALHIHPKTKKLAGPHCRSYYPSYRNSPPETDGFYDHIDNGRLDKWFKKLISNRPDTMNIRETSDFEKKTSIGTYHGKSFSLGVTTRELDSQSNRFTSNQSIVFSIKYTQEKDDRPGIAYSKYLLNDKWIGDFRSTPSRGNRDIFFDEGSFRGIQNGKRSINIYAPNKYNPLNLNGWNRCFSAKTCIIWDSSIDEIWINEKKVKELPIDLSHSDVIVVGSGDILIGIKPLSLTDLGSNAPIKLIQRQEQLVLELYNYLGPAKTFWELANPGAFYQGQPRSGFYSEVAEKSEFSNGGKFASEILKGKLTEKFDEPETYDVKNKNLWSIEYERNAESIGIELDMIEFEIEKIWTNDNNQDLFPMLDSPIAIQKSKGDILLNDSILECDGKGSRLLVSIPESNLWIATYNGPSPSSFSLKTSQGNIEIDQLTRGLVKWENGKVEVETTGLKGTPRIKGAQITKIN